MVFHKEALSAPLLFLLYKSKLPKLLPNTRRSLFAEDFMIYSEPSITRSDLIQSNLQTSMDALTLFNSNHRIILSCTKSVRVLFERRKSNRLKPQEVSPSSSFVKFLGITFDSALTFRSHFRTVAILARHRLLKLNSIFSPTYVPSTSTLIHLYKSYIRSLFDYGAPAAYVASPNIVGSGYKLISFRKHYPFHPSYTKKRQHAYLPPIHDRNMYLAKRWYRRAMQHNRGGTGLHRQSHSQQTQHSQQPQYTTWTDQELIIK